MDIRGYGPVKEAAIHKVQAEVERLWARLAEQPEVVDMRPREAAHA
ncbi:MAG: pyruvate ferredoxin oxidoreductase [Microvirga sp.]|nr:pyruvate ferredoxin oxidoreductase [Microvirga sp.]